MSNLIKIGNLKGSPKFRVYIAQEEGALLVRRAQVSNLGQALKIAANASEALYVEIRTWWNGQERLVQIERP